MKPEIPLFKPYFDSDEIEEIQRVLDSGWVSQGPKVKELEAKLAEYLGVRHVIAVTNGTSALHLSLLSIGIKEGDEVLVSDYTFLATGHVVVHCGARPIFVDVDFRTYNINPDMIESKITARTKAIMPVHTFGQPDDMDEIMKIANKYNLKVIEDAACALGAKYRNRFAGTIGDIGCFSFHARKGITTGEGGIVATDDRKLAEKISNLSVFGMSKPAWEREGKNRFIIPEYTAVGYNYKMSDIAAAVGVAQLRKLDKIINRKQALAKCWDEKLKNSKFITPPYISEDVVHAYQGYVTLIDGRFDRNKIIEALMKKGVQTQIGTYASHIQSVYGSKDKCPNSLTIFNRALSLPIYYTLKEKDIDIAAEIVKETLEELK